MKRKLGALGLIILINLVISNAVVLILLRNALSFGTYVKYELFLFVFLMLFANVLLSNKICSGKAQEWVFFLSVSMLVACLIAFVFYSFIKSDWKIGQIAWTECLKSVLGWDWLYYGITLGIFVAVVAFYCGIFDRGLLRFTRTTGLIGKGNIDSIEANLENSRWMSKEEKQRIFKNCKYTKLNTLQTDGVPVMAQLNKRGNDEDVMFNSPCHSIIIGATGSGKTTTFVNPMIQILASTSAGSSMVVTDPKGELFSVHSAYLAERGYDVKVIDLRDAYSSYRWNPLDAIWDNYQKYADAHNNAFLRKDALDEDMPLGSPKETFSGKDVWYEFEGKAYSEYADLVNAIKVFKRKTYDEVYEDLNDLVSVLVPIDNERDPMWEKGARNMVLATLLAMLEDSEEESLGMTKEKFNFFNLTKILQNSADDYLQLRRYFVGRSPLSKAFSLSKQVCDAAETTRASYMSVVYEKLTLFNDAGICALTSASDFVPEDLAARPTALFLKIPDEKTTRHNLAGIFVLNLYKQLIKTASANADLTLPRNVYYILDEFGNMPKIENFDKMITVGRSRKIWFNMIVQSYSQLNNVYGDRVAEIIKGNCGIKMFIGSNDMATCKEFSELCGNVTVVTRSTSGTDEDKAVNVSTQAQVRPLIYPSELQRLNHGSDIGHSVIVTFGNYPFKSYFTPSFKVSLYKKGAMKTDFLSERYFDEQAVFYDVEKRNEAIFGQPQESGAVKTKIELSVAKADNGKVSEATDKEKADVEKDVSGDGNKYWLEKWLKFREEHPELSEKDIFATLEAISKG